MKDLTKLDKYRLSVAENRIYGTNGDHQNGMFLIHSIHKGDQLIVIASVGEGWEHLSVSLRNRCPDWEEMEQVKKLFFGTDVVAMQLHVPEKDHINIAKNCLHIWRPINYPIPMPPSNMIGF